MLEIEWKWAHVCTNAKAEFIITGCQHVYFPFHYLNQALSTNNTKWTMTSQNIHEKIYLHPIILHPLPTNYRDCKGRLFTSRWCHHRHPFIREGQEKAVIMHYSESCVGTTDRIFKHKRDAQQRTSRLTRLPWSLLLLSFLHNPIWICPLSRSIHP